ncbi:MAG TPA: nucleotide exchange factor GrpE [Candidatus Binatia bacterium]|jgi:molecular chaperone GrpE|nr:nucleotide exchange factor GrpE [Candidatus Binatia bacterium]
MADDETRDPIADPTPAADPSPPPDLEARLRHCEAELEAARAEARQNHERWLRERADLENFRKRAAREREEIAKFGNEQVLKDLLPVVDNLERAIEHARGGGNGQPLVDGVALVLKSLLAVLERHGVTRVESKGTRFDPTQHEAMAQIESAEHEPNSVVEEHQAGYRLNDRLIRPALVTVAKPPSGQGNLAKDKSGD